MSEKISRERAEEIEIALATKGVYSENGFAFTWDEECNGIHGYREPVGETDLPVCSFSDDEAEASEEIAEWLRERSLGFNYASYDSLSEAADDEIKRRAQSISEPESES